MHRFFAQPHVKRHLHQGQRELISLGGQQRKRRLGYVDVVGSTPSHGRKVIELLPHDWGTTCSQLAHHERTMFALQGQQLSEHDESIQEEPGIATRSKKLLRAPGHTTRSRDPIRGSWHHY